MKKTIVVIFTMLIILFIFISTKDTKVYYLAISDNTESIELSNKIEKYYKNKQKYENYVKYIKNNYRIIDFIHDIDMNKKINEDFTLRNALIKADIITIMIGNNDYLSYINDVDILNDGVLELKDNMREFLEVVRNISKEKIVFIGIPNIYQNNVKLNNFLKELNEMYRNLCSEYNIYYLDIFDILKDQIYQNKLSTEGYQIIFNELIKEVDNVIIN